MYEHYENPKFKTIFLSKKLPKTKKAVELIEWFRKFYDAGLAPEYRWGSSGNLSFRHRDCFVIKCTRAYFKTIKPENLVFVKKFGLKEKIAYVHGKCIPSTESQMHYLIYKNKKNINAIFHIHDYSVMKVAKKHKIPITKVTEPGTSKIGYDVLRVMNNKRFVVMKKRGVVALGKSINEAGNMVLHYHKIASK